MKTHQPYRISHISLHEPVEMPELDHHQGNYLVFWWKTIPLGDLYLEPGTNTSTDEYYKAMGQAILPTLNHYAQNPAELKANYLATTSPDKLKNLQSWLPANLQITATEIIPEKVAVSVVVCTRNRAAHLKCCLTMLQNLTCRPAEIIVIDNAPTDESTREVVSAFSEVKYIREPRPGLDIARNTGVSNAKFPIVAFTDDDVSVHPLWTYQIWQTFEKPQVAAMTGLVIAAELATEAQYIFEKHWSFNRGYTDVKYDSDFFRKTLRKGPPVWNIGAGANMAFRREIFEEVGYFDELLDVGAAGCNGDSEMWYRILKAGHTIHYNPRAVAFHEHRKEIEGLKKQLFYYMRGYTAAALLQQQQLQQAGYAKQIFWVLPRHYLRLLRSGFPHYSYRYRTIAAEMLGVLSGLAYYIKNKRPNTKLSR
ncbi:glycosyltransferase [Adhaeribacter sp. BT258]|uniref:Glycosyltransferase n=1 Tax=Adhaeribacter terrigena TaxID=2793070 RepID=A0ABS1BXM9_9BACT|nr:glycosyltransferase [Adhaeribacter terrigena]MBK0401908.1 glycosyltransferase [Adhaeribacter terrigena]